MPDMISPRQDGGLKPGPHHGPGGGAWTDRLGSAQPGSRIPALDIALLALAVGFIGMKFVSDDPQVQAVMLAAHWWTLVVFAVRLVLRIRWQAGYREALRRCQEVNAIAETQRARDTQARAARRMAFNLPRQPLGEGYLYVVEFSTGTVKVGQTEDPKQRLGTHRAEAAAFGVHIANYWISPSHLNFKNNETRLINRCVEVSHRSRKEYFHAVTYTRAREFARGLTYHSGNLSQRSVEGVWA